MSNETLATLLNLPSPLQTSIQSETDNHPVLHIKRDDLIHPALSGNKYRKLLGQLEAFYKARYKGIVTMGGAWSNHVHACSWLCHKLQIPLKIIIRGHEPREYSSMLEDALHWGAELQFVSRQDYRQLRSDYESDRQDLNTHIRNYPEYYFIPEGGRAMHVETGMMDLAAEFEHNYDAVYMAVGTGSTLAGLCKYWSNPNTTFHGILAVDAKQSQLETINMIAPDSRVEIQLRNEFLFGGYARTNASLENFMARIYAELKLPLDPVYTAKAYYALCSDIDAGKYDAEDRILFIHTGGLQGLRGFSQSVFDDIKSAVDWPLNLPFNIY